MRTLSYLPLVTALLFAAGCEDKSPSIISPDTAKTAAAPRDTAKAEPADKQALRVQRDAKLDAPEQAKADEKAQYDKQKAGSMPAGQGAMAEARSVTAQVTKASDSQVELKGGDDQALKLAVDDQTAVRIDGQQGKASQIAEGSEVRASYKTVDGKMTALRLDVTSNPAAKPADDKAPPAK